MACTQLRENAFPTKAICDCICQCFWPVTFFCFCAPAATVSGWPQNTGRRRPRWLARNYVKTHFPRKPSATVSASVFDNHKRAGKYNLFDICTNSHLRSGFYCFQMTLRFPPFCELLNLYVANALNGEPLCVVVVVPTTGTRLTTVEFRHVGLPK